MATKVEPKHIRDLLDELTKETTKTNIRQKLKEAFLYGQQTAMKDYLKKEICTSN